MGKHVLTDRPSSGVASLWPSFRPRSDLVWVQCSCCPVAPYSYCCLHRFLSGCSSCKFGRRIAQFAWSASPTSLSDVWLAARCFHSAWHLDCYRLSCCEWLWPTLKLWSLKDKRPSPQIFDESRCANSGIRLVMSSMNTSFGRIPSHNDFLHKSKTAIHWELLLNMHLKHNALWHSGLANRKGIVDVGTAPFAISDFVSYGVPLGWGEICPINVRSLKSVCQWVDVRSAHWCEKARALVYAILLYTVKYCMCSYYEYVFLCWLSYIDICGNHCMAYRIFRSFFIMSSRFSCFFVFFKMTVT